MHETGFGELNVLDLAGAGSLIGDDRRTDAADAVAELQEMLDMISS